MAVSAPCNGETWLTNSEAVEVMSWYGLNSTAPSAIPILIEMNVN